MAHFNHDQYDNIYYECFTCHHRLAIDKTTGVYLLVDRAATENWVEITVRDVRGKYIGEVQLCGMCYQAEFFLLKEHLNK